jgi:hypothetical protein
MKNLLVATLLKIDFLTFKLFNTFNFSLFLYEFMHQNNIKDKLIDKAFKLYQY